MENQIKPLLPYNPNIDEKTAMEEALKIWAWLKDSGNDKDDHHEIETLAEYDCVCPLCEVFRLRYLTEVRCKKCPLINGNLKCFEEGQLYEKWEDSLCYHNNPSMAAAAIYDKIAQSYKQRYGVEFNPYVTPESVSE